MTISASYVTVNVQTSLQKTVDVGFFVYRIGQGASMLLDVSGSPFVGWFFC